jgi:histidine kinase
VDCLVGRWRLLGALKRAKGSLSQHRWVESRTLASEHLSLLLRTSRLLNSLLDIQHILDTLMGQTIEVLGAERGFVLWRTDEQQAWQFRSAVALKEEDMSGLSLGVVERVAAEGKAITTSDAQQDERFRQQASIGLYNLRSICCAPIVIDSRTLGVLYVDHRLATGAFDLDSQALLEALASQAAIALEKALLVDRLKEMHERALELARQELAETQAQLLQASKLAAVGQLAAGVAHEINNPLGAILINLTGMKKQLGEHPAAARLKICEAAIERCKTITSRLLSFAQKTPSSQESCQAQEVVTQTLDLAEADLRRCQIRLIREIQPVSVRFDPTELSQILLNLLLNARDALLLVERERSLWVRLSPAGLLEVVDNGSGMTPEIEQRVFEPFFTTKPVGQGVGLGLSTCYQMVVQQGGSIRLESKPGQGTRFCVQLPC